MKEQIKEIFEGMKVDQLQELKAYLGGLQKEIADDLKRRTSEEISDEGKFLEIFSSLISVLGSAEIIKIIEEIERRRKEEGKDRFNSSDVSEMLKKLTFAIDLDGTITQVDEYPKIGAVNEDAVSVINDLYNAGHYIIIWTCRDNIVHVGNYLKLNKIKYHKINMNNPASIQKYLSDPRKIGADYYIDDKALSLFNKKIDWKEIRNLLEEKGAL